MDWLWCQSRQTWSVVGQTLEHNISCTLHAPAPLHCRAEVGDNSQGAGFPSPQATLIPAGQPEAAANELLSKPPIILHCCNWKKICVFPFQMNQAALECCLHDLLQHLVTHGKHWMDNEAEGKQ